MKLKPILFVVLIICSNLLWSQKTDVDFVKTMFGNLKIKPILHSSLVLTHMNKTIYVDPYGGAKLYKGLPSPDIVLITDIHGDQQKHVNEQI